MVTGDNVVTACAIAKEAGIFEDNYIEDPMKVQENFTVLEGKKFRQLVGGIVYEQVNSESDIGS